MSLKTALIYNRDAAVNVLLRRGRMSVSPFCSQTLGLARSGMSAQWSGMSGGIIRPFHWTKLNHSQNFRSQMGIGAAVRYIWQRKFRLVCTHVESQLKLCVSLFANQCNAIVAQRVRRALQTICLYRDLGYDRQALKNMVDGLKSSFMRGKKDRPLYMLFSAVLFSWKRDKITDEEINGVSDEINQVQWSATGEKVQIDDAHVKNGWEVIIDKQTLVVWRKAIPDTYLYEYKVLGTYTDIPARAFYNAQLDFDYRKTWDNLIVKLDVVDEDPDSGCEVVQWITHFPYPMYNREYVYIRKATVDDEQKVMVLKSRSIHHPACPEQDKYVRVHTYLSQMVIRPHSTFDENGFDYILTYQDDPKASFPAPAYNWMARTGVPDFVSKMHAEAKRLHHLRKGVGRSDEENAQQSQDQGQMAI